jgi:hypothetical protein
MTDFGAYLPGLWGLPVPIVEGVALHHTPAKSAMLNFSPLTAVHVANVLQHEADKNPEKYVLSCLDDDYLAELDLTDQLPNWRAALEQLRDEAIQ